MIPISDIVTVNPGVLTGGGSSLSLNGVVVSQNSLIPVATVQSFASAAAVSAFFGPSSTEYALAQIYFAGFDNSTILPGAMLFAPQANVARSAWLQSGSLAAMTLAGLQALGSGTLICTVDGTLKTSSSIALGAVASFTAAATAITTAFTSGVVCTWNAVNSTFTLTSSTTGATSTITQCTGTLATGLLFTAATGSLISQGTAIETPGNSMDKAKAYTLNWASFMTLFEPSLSDKELYAAWSNAQNDRFLYVCWDTDAQAIVANSSTCFGAVEKALASDGVMAVYNTVGLAAFVIGMIASIDFARQNGRITADFRAQSGLAATVTDQQISQNLLGNGYSYYGTYANSNSQFTFLNDGNIPGKWKWMDSYVNQIQLNSAFKAALITLLTSVNSIPYNEQGYSLIRAAMQDPINAALNFGSIRTGIVLSASQKAQVNQAAGRDVALILQQQGYYLQILDPGASVRTARGTPVVNFWYTDGGAVQKITVASIDIL